MNKYWRVTFDRIWITCALNNDQNFKSTRPKSHLLVSSSWNNWFSLSGYTMIDDFPFIRTRRFLSDPLNLLTEDFSAKVVIEQGSEIMENSTSTFSLLSISNWNSIKKYCKYFFNYYLVTPRLTFGHYREGNLTQPMLITVFLHNQPEGLREPRHEVGSLKPGWAPSGVWTRNLPILITVP